MLPTRLTRVDAATVSARTNLRSACARRDPPIVARVEDGRVLLDLRTVFPEQDRADRGRPSSHRDRRVPASKLLATLYTIGHSTRPLDDLVAALHAHQIQNARRYPRLPHVAPPAAFNRDSLEQSCLPPEFVMSG